MRSQGLARHARQSYRFAAQLTGALGSLDHIWGLAAGAYGNQNIARDGQGLHLPGENIFIPVIVAERGKRRSVGRERDGWETRGAVVHNVQPARRRCVERQQRCLRFRKAVLCSRRPAYRRLIGRSVQFPRVSNQAAIELPPDALPASSSGEMRLNSPFVRGLPSVPVVQYRCREILTVKFAGT